MLSLIRRWYHFHFKHVGRKCTPSIVCDVCSTWIRGREGQTVKQLHGVARSFGWGKSEHDDLCPKCVLQRRVIRA